MVENENKKVTASAVIDLVDQEVRIDKLALDTGGEEIRISFWSGGLLLPQPLVLTENQILDILHQAVHAGVLPRNFIGKLRERIEI